MRSLIVLCMAGVLAAGCGPSATSSGAPSASGPPSVAPGSSVAVVPSPGVGSAGHRQWLRLPTGAAGIDRVRPLRHGVWCRGALPWQRADPGRRKRSGAAVGAARVRGTRPGLVTRRRPTPRQHVVPGGLGRPGILAPDGSDFTPLNPRASPITSAASTGRRTVRPWSARSAPTRSRRSTASTCSGSTISSSIALPRARTTTPLDQPGSAAGRRSRDVLPGWINHRVRPAEVRDGCKSVGRRVGGDRADGPRWHRPA